MAATPASSFLKARGIAFAQLEYRHDPRAEGYGMEAAEKLGLHAASVFKTLVVWDEGKAHALALVPVASRLSLGAAAKALGWKRATLARPADAERLTGYVLGGISPFGTRRPLPVVADRSISLLAAVHVSGGRRGVEIRVGTGDLMRALDARLADIAAV